MVIKPMDPALVLASIEGYQNELEPQSNALNAFYRQFRCKRCGSSCQKEFLRNHAFSDPDTLVARSCLRCTNCRCLFDPHSGILLELGDGTPANER